MVGDHFANLMHLDEDKFYKNVIIKLQVVDLDVLFLFHFSL